MRFAVIFVVVVVVCMGASLHAQASSIVGDWQEPGGAVIEIEPCTSGLCLRLLSLSPHSPDTTDVNNPDAALRRRALCNLEIGSQFHLSDATHASGGMLYDPKSGRTYRGTMDVEGNSLHLRGYVGIPLFGRTEVWQRVSGTVAPCHA